MNISHHTIRDCTPNFATPAEQIPANPSQIPIFSQARYKLLAKGWRSQQSKSLGTWGYTLAFVLYRLCNVLGKPLQVVAVKTKVCWLIRLNLGQRQACPSSKAFATSCVNSHCFLLCWGNQILGKIAGLFCQKVWSSQDIASYESCLLGSLEPDCWLTPAFLPYSPALA